MDTTQFLVEAKGLLVENARWQQWVAVSLAFDRIDVWFRVIMQMLGRLDCELIYEDQLFTALSAANQGTIEESFKLSGRFTHSYLWVLGLYELLRTLDQKCTENAYYFSGPLNQAIKDLKKKVERLRIPLAKLEPSRRNKEDSPIAYPAIHKEFGISWRIAADVFISRRELSDETLSLFNAISESVKKVN